jgi:membrane-bound ClpP family serine protease
VAGLLDQPAVVIVAAALASVCLLLEVALPTVGVAGTTGVALGALAAWGVDRQGGDWWPLLGVLGAIALWGVLVAAHRTSSVGHPVAVVLFLAGSLGYAVATSDTTAAATAVLCTAALIVVYPRIGAAAARLGAAPPAVGPGSMVGLTGVVADWEAGRGHVLVGGTRWSATGPEELAEGVTVVVAAVTGLSLSVQPIGSRHG